VVVLLTDGENNRSTIDPTTGAELARAMGVTIYAIGVGRVAVAPSGDTPAQGDRPRAGFNEAALEQLASATGGQYFRADDVTTLRSVFQTIDALERSPVAAPSYLRRRELFWIPAATAIALAALELLLRHTLLRRLP
jgi:Ca-activated chloride channel family protein